MWKTVALMLAGAPLVGLGAKLLSLYKIGNLPPAGIAKVLGILLVGIGLWILSGIQFARKKKMGLS